MAQTKTQWTDYYDATRQRPARPLLQQAVEFVTDRGSALDLGAGALQDSRFLLAEGFSVTAVDQDPQSAVEAKNIHSSKFQFISSPFDQFLFPLESYDIVAALFALPFNPPDTFDRVLQDLLDSIKPGGIFVGQFFGPRDAWNTPDSGLSFHNRSDVERLMAGHEILKLEEEEKDAPTATGPEKYWHVFHVIARKN